MRVGVPTLPMIITAARAGALDHAERLFAEAGYDARGDDPAALAVRGRLLKDRALRSPPAARAALFARAAAAYREADRVAPQPYTRINLATLTLLAGDSAAACAIARTILDWLAEPGAVAETPFYIAATRAEALLLCGDDGGARRALAAARAAAPEAYDDIAGTLRQLALIAESRAIDADWLEEFRPPRSLHFAGHLGVAARGTEALAERIDAILAAEHVGFGFGALAAGADIVIAERVLASGAELHAVLPIAPAPFAAQSVTRYGADWAERYAACLAAATSVTATARATGEYEPLATRLASDVAMGAAAMNARRLSSEAVQVVVVDDDGGGYGRGLATARDAERWRAADRRSHVLAWPRTAAVPASGTRKRAEGRADRRLAAMLHIGFVGLDDLDEREFALELDRLRPFRAAAQRLAPRPELTLPIGNNRIVAFTTPEAAWDYARAALAHVRDEARPLRVAAHYALAHWLDDPPALVGRGVGELDRIAAAALPGVLTVSEVFATALFLAARDALYAEPVGEAGDIRLFALRGG